MMKFKITLLTSFFCCLSVFANELPDLGDSSQLIISAKEEQAIAKAILREVAVSPEIVQDIEVIDYLKNLGNRLVAYSPNKTQQFNFFVVNESSINAFAMLGGVIGVHTGLILAANSESEVASVLGHEIAHVTQRHLPRMIAQQKNDSIKSILGIALALLVARANPQLSAGTMTAASAMGVQKQLDYTRDHEKEADRVGFQILTDAGFDGRAMVSFFATLQKGSRFSEGAAPSFLRTHPITTERISDMSNRVKETRYRQIQDNPDFVYIKSKLRAANGTPQSAVDEFEGSIKDKRFMNEAAERYGLATAYMRKNDFIKARQEVEWLKINAKRDVLIETLTCKLEVATNHPAQALNLYLKALNLYPNHRALIYGLAELYLMINEPEKTIKLINDKLNIYPDDSYFFELLSKAYSKEGKELLQYQAQSEAYYRKFNLPRAIEQMEFAAKSKDGNFYQKSIVESRLKQLIFENSLEDIKDKK
ncbi:MAG: M48 family metallopeptidase [Betaproteobacteria bacterium]|nr:M48 family metallopeptidase [Betaproteobacteria bacterium]